ncbi:MAG: sulfatase-like hydrolase/transferase, partial [Planctomycetes bacterium]|nr:sulfatase-like hydrolase/transferase [Planctomycetota bacterium]
MLPPNTPKKPSKFNCSTTFLTALVLALGIACADALAVLIYELPTADSLRMVLKPIALKMAMISLFFAVFWSLCVYPAGRIFKLQSTRTIPALAVFVAVVYFCDAPLAATGFHSLTQTIKSLAIWSAASLAGYVCAVTCYVTLAHLNTHNRRTVATALCLATPVILVELLLALWLDKLWFEQTVSEAGSIVAVLLSWQVVLLHIGFLLVFLATLWKFIQLNRKSQATKVFAAFASIIFLASLLIMFSDSRQSIPVKIENQSNQKNSQVLLIVIDTLRADALSCYGNKTIETPAFDRLAADSILFEKAITPAPWTIPALASIMTALAPSVHLATKYKSQLPDEVTTLAEKMNDAGYQTAAIGSNLIVRRRNLSQGFNEFNFFPRRKDNSPCGRILEQVFPRQFRTEASTTDLTDLAIDWLDSNAQNNSFLWLH